MSFANTGSQGLCAQQLSPAKPGLQQQPNLSLAILFIVESPLYRQEERRSDHTLSQGFLL